MPPVNTCKDTESSCSSTTWASDVSPSQFSTTARSPKPTSLARTRRMSPTIQAQQETVLPPREPDSAPYNSDALCEQSLTTQSTAHHKRGYRCVLAEYTDQKVSAAARSNVTYVGFEWKVESAESHGWEYTGETTYRNEALCQQSLWHQSKINPNRDYRCISGDYR